MRKWTFAVVALAALVATSLAVAHGIEGAKSAKAVAATFTATAASTSTRTCTTAEGKVLTVTSGRYSGTATGDPDLTGPITLSARSTVNTTDGVGVVEGQLKIDVASGRNTWAGYTAVYDHGNIAGVAVGRAHDPHAKLLANLSAGFSAAGGFTSGKLGGGTAGGGAVELGPSSCKASSNTPHEKSEAKGTITALSATSITVAGLTCAIPADKSSDVNAKFKVNDRAEIRCELSNAQNTLTRIEKKR
jgi:hypothetical protein